MMQERDRECGEQNRSDVQELWVGEECRENYGCAVLRKGRMARVAEATICFVLTGVGRGRMENEK